MMPIKNRRIRLLWVVAGIVFPVLVLAQSSSNGLVQRVIGPDSNNGSSSGGGDNDEELLDCCHDQPVQPNRTVVKLGYLAAVKGDLSNR